MLVDRIRNVYQLDAVCKKWYNIDKSRIEINNCRIQVIHMKYIKRSIEDLVNASNRTFKCVLVTGARQTGKSTMLKTLFPDKKYVPYRRSVY